jgi:polysaccharide export outer membrane protein
MEKKRVNRITVVGAVSKPGVYELPRGSSDLLAAIVAAGGLAEDAGIDVDVRSPARRGRQAHPPAPSADRTANAAAVQPAAYHTASADQPARSVRINLVSATLAGGEDLRLRDGDVVSVTKRDPMPLQVLGLVRKPGRYEMPPNQELRVLDAIALAGGISSSVADEIIVIRRTPDHPDAAVIKVSLSQAKADGAENIVLASGDVISVEQTVATVALDAIKNFVRIGLSSRIPVF